jgi:hypothetical protein
LATAGALGLLLAGCGSKAVALDAPPARAPGPAVTTASPAPTTATRNPLTGLPGPVKPVVAVKVDNVSTAPQSGLNDADVVYCEQVEGGLTRLLAVFSSTTPTTVGPVRSARTSDIELLGQYGRVALAFSGANSGVMAAVRAANLQDDAYDYLTSAYHFDKSRPAPYRFLVDTAAVLAQAPGAPARDVGFRFGAEPASSAAHPATPVLAATVRYPDTTITATWEAADGTWRMSRNGAPLRQQDGKQAEARDVLIQYVTIGMSGYSDHNGAHTPTSHTIGSGPAVLLRDGKRYDGTWSRASLSAPTVWTAAAGGSLTMAPGRVWVLLAPAGTGLAIG